MVRVAVASPSYIKQHGRPKKPEDLLEHQCVCINYAPSGLWCFEGVNQGKPLPVQGRFRSNDVDSVFDAAVAGLGVAHLASWLVYKKIETGELVHLFPEYTAAAAANPKTPAIHAVRLKGRSHSAKAQLFIAHLKKAFGEVPYWEVDGVERQK
jgi:DNA-binding transcriptional LysR family regulator